MGNLFQELKRRKVFRVAAVYAVVAWLLIQVADTLFPALQLPDWTVTFVTVLFILGFPIALVLAWAYELSAGGVHADTGQLVQPQKPASQNQALIYAIFVLVLLVAVFQITDRFILQERPTLIDSSVQPSTSARLSRKLFINLGETTTRGRGDRLHAEIAVSPDGSKLVYKVQRPDTETLPQLWLRDIDEFESRLLASGKISKPFFSPDGEWIAYIDPENTELHKLSIRGGASQLLASDVNGATGGFWHTDDYLYLSDNNEPSDLIRVSADGNRVENLKLMVDTQAFDVWPHPLPDNESLLFSNFKNRFDISIGLLSLQTGELNTLIDNGYYARYVPTGHIAFMRDSNLWAVPFDLESKEIVGNEVTVARGLEAQSGLAKGGYTFSAEGTLFYVPGRDVSAQTETSVALGNRQLVWVDRDGNEEPVSLDIHAASLPVISPDGQRLTLALNISQSRQVWIYNLQSNLLSQLTFTGSASLNPLWNPDGSRIAYYSSREGGGLWWRPANGTGEEELLVSAADSILRPNAFTPDGTQLVYELDGDLFLLSIGSDDEPELLLGTNFVEARASLSPNGRWIAYESNESGEFKIYVRPFPDVDEGKWQISNTAGIWPKWSSEGDALFYRGISPNYASVWETRIVSSDLEGEFQFEPPTQLFTGDYARESERNFGSVFDVLGDGSRFLLLNDPDIPSSLTDSENTQVAVIENWFEELQRLAPRN